MLREHARKLYVVTLLADGAVTFGSFALALFIRQSAFVCELLGLAPIQPGWDTSLVAALAALAWPTAFRVTGGYISQRRRGAAAVGRSVILGSLVGASLFLGAAFLLGFHSMSRVMIVSFVALNTAALLGGRLLVLRLLHVLRQRGYNFRNVVLIGSGPRAREVAEQLEKRTSWGIRVIGFLDDEPSQRDLAAVGSRYLGGVGQLIETLRRETVDEVVLAQPRSALGSDATAHALGLCELHGVDFTIATDLFHGRIATPHFHEVDSVPLVTLGHHGPTIGWQPALKRLIDICGSLAVIALTLPLWIAAAIAIKLDSRGPVFFVQPRSGRNGRPFPCVKFRTMHTDAEDRLAELRTQNEVSGPVFKLRDDPRITRVGRVLRRYSIDELPQLLSVVVGHMSLVGPRPPIPTEVDAYEPDQLRRLSVRPGITGLWQVSGRTRIAFEDWVRLDLQYIDEWSVLLDLQILWATIPAVLQGEGAS